MTIGQWLSRFSRIIWSTVPARIPPRDVQVGCRLLVQWPVDLRLIPAVRSSCAACRWASLIAADRWRRWCRSGRRSVVFQGAPATELGWKALMGSLTDGRELA
jgi:hypothetical protein